MKDSEDYVGAPFWCPKLSRKTTKDGSVECRSKEGVCKHLRYINWKLFFEEAETERVCVYPRVDERTISRF